MISPTAKILIATTFCATIIACSNAKTITTNLPAFCEVGRAQTEGGKLYIDVKGKKAFVAQGKNYNVDLTTVTTEEYIGIVSPMHLLVPTNKALRNKETLRWVLPGYKFTVELPSNDDDGWMLVRSRASEEANNFDTTMDPMTGKRAQTIWHIGTDVLYSPAAGIIAYQDITHINGEIFLTAFYRCSDAQLNFEKFE